MLKAQWIIIKPKVSDYIQMYIIFALENIFNVQASTKTIIILF
jgi:hypothetical protein